MSRSLVVLGTASQAPTRERNQNGYLLRWEDLGILFDPGEGTQRQLLLAGQRSSSITHIAITHHHGDHCLGLPGVLLRMMLDQRTEPVTLIHPASATPFIDRLLGLGLFDGGIELERVPLPETWSTLDLGTGRVLHARPLDHRVPTLGYRVQDPTVRRFRQDALDALGLAGPVVGRLHEEGQVLLDGRTIRLEQVSDEVPGSAMAVVMDTRVCEQARLLLSDVDLALVESTFRDGDEALARTYGHMTAGQAGRLAAAAGARRLVLTHFSQRYDDIEGFASQAAVHHDDVTAAADLTVHYPSYRAVPSP